jgi:hypothetical protein
MFCAPVAGAYCGSLSSRPRTAYAPTVVETETSNSTISITTRSGLSHRMMSSPSVTNVIRPQTVVGGSCRPLSDTDWRAS